MSLLSISTQLANYAFLGLVAGIPAYGSLRKVKVYESFIAGAKDGFHLTVNILPSLVAMLVAIGMLRASGAFQYLNYYFAPLLKQLGMPHEVLPLALIRPFSGSAANGLMAELIHTHGGDSFIARLAATMVGSTETTFYVIAVYFGVINIQRLRYAIVVGLLADGAGILASVIVCRYLFG